MIAVFGISLTLGEVEPLFPGFLVHFCGLAVSVLCQFLPGGVFPGGLSGLRALPPFAGRGMISISTSLLGPEPLWVRLGIFLLVVVALGIFVYKYFPGKLCQPCN